MVHIRAEQTPVAPCGCLISDRRWPLSDDETGVSPLGKTEDLLRGPGSWNCCLDVGDCPALRIEENTMLRRRCEKNNQLAHDHLMKMAHHNHRKAKYEEWIRVHLAKLHEIHDLLEEVCILRRETALEIKRLEVDSHDAMVSACSTYLNRERSRSRSRARRPSRRRSE